MIHPSIKIHPLLRSLAWALVVSSMTACNVVPPPSMPSSGLNPPVSDTSRQADPMHHPEMSESSAASFQIRHASTPAQAVNTPVQTASFQSADTSPVTQHPNVARIPMQARTGGPVIPGAPYPSQWTPPQISYPWPEDEYVYQGGDSRQQVNVAQDYSIHNLDEEDTIVHYHTLDGKIAVQPTNQIPIYAPRFSSVRHISGASQYQQQDHAYGVDNPQAIAGTQDKLGSEQVLQRLQADLNISNRRTGLYRDQSKARDVEYRIASLEGSQRQKPEDGLLLNTRVRIQNSQEARLSKQNIAAITSTDEETVKIFAKDFLPSKITGQSQMQATYHYEIPEGKSRLEIIKTSSNNTALPGDELEFTITYKNVGDQPVGNVTIVDHLSRRLVYLEDSQKSEADSEFSTTETNRESQIMRWEITAPLEVGQSGKITFRCRVR